MNTFKNFLRFLPILVEFSDLKEDLPRLRNRYREAFLAVKQLAIDPIASLNQHRIRNVDFLISKHLDFYLYLIGELGLSEDNSKSFSFFVQL